MSLVLLEKDVCCDQCISWQNTISLCHASLGVLNPFAGSQGWEFGNKELLIAKFRLKLKKVGKTTRPFRYDLNKIPEDYTVEVRNRLKGLELTDRVPEELWTEVRNVVQEAVIKTIPKEKMQEGKMVV